jgi:eukaryotic-like serine/threonine-protein kinase
MTQDDELVHQQTPPPAARVICPRCRVGEVTYGSSVCPLCGFSPATGEVVEDPLPAALDEAVRRELGEEMRIERLLGRGGMSLVYLAREIELNRLVAVKVLPIRLAMGADATERFKREAKIGASLDHPHIVPVHRVGTTPTFLWYTMKWVKGGSLRDLLDRNGSMSLADCLKVLEPVGAALHYAHRRGVIHRDIKPANILIDDTGWVGICDFGIAKAFGATPLTNTGATVGTPGYMPPEQCYGKPLDGRADQYSLAILTFECLAGRVPFTGDSLGEMVRKHCLEPPPPIRDLRPDVPPEVDAALTRALSKRPEDRFETVLDFVRALGGDPTRGGTLVVEAVDAVSLASVPTQPLSGRRPRWMLRWLPAAALLLAVGGALLYARGRHATARPSQAPPAAAPPAAAPSPQVEPGYLSVGSTPWAIVYVDGDSVGTTPLQHLPVRPGRHLMRLMREGYESAQQELEIASGTAQTIANVVLKPVR